MEFLKSVGKALSGAVGFVGDKSRKVAHLNRIRTVIKCEEQAADKEYLALGRYYYNNLRDKNNPVTEAHCAELEAIEARLDKALDQLEQFYQQEQSGGLTVTIDIVKDEDGPTAAYTRKGAAAEEVTLEDVEEFDHDPMAEAPAAPSVQAPAPAEPNENDSLPFEG